MYVRRTVKYTLLAAVVGAAALLVACLLRFEPPDYTLLTAGLTTRLASGPCRLRGGDVDSTSWSAELSLAEVREREGPLREALEGRETITVGRLEFRRRENGYSAAWRDRWVVHFQLMMPEDDPGPLDMSYSVMRNPAYASWWEEMRDCSTSRPA